MALRTHYFQHVAPSGPQQQEQRRENDTLSAAHSLRTKVVERTKLEQHARRVALRGQPREGVNREGVNSVSSHLQL